MTEYCIVYTHDGKLWNKVRKRGLTLFNRADALLLAKETGAARWKIEVYEKPSDIRYQELISSETYNDNSNPAA